MVWRKESGLIFSLIINVMLLLDSFLLLLIIVGLHFIKIKYPNFLFFCKGAILFLPSDEDKPTTKKSKKQKEEVEIRIIQLEYNHVKEYPMADEYDRILFILAGLVIYVPFKWLISLIVDHTSGQQNTIGSSSFTFIVCFSLLVYVVKVGLQIFWISSYNLKYCFAIGIALNALFFMLYLSTSGIGAYDKALEWAMEGYKKQLSIIVGKQLENSSSDVKYLLIVVLVINLIITLISIPAVIKFGNWYTKTLKEVYYDDEATSKIKDPQQRKQKEEKEALLKKKSKNSIRLLNLYLVTVLVFLFFSHSYAHKFIDSSLIDVIRVGLMVLIAYINCYTLREAIQFNGSFAYKYISQYASSEDLEERKALRAKIMPYLYFVWYHKFQLMFRVIIPVLLFLIVLDWKYMHTDSNPLAVNPTISHTHCGIQTNHLHILENLYQCSSSTPTTHIHDASTPFLNGMLISGNHQDDLQATQEKVAQYGLLNVQFMAELFEQILWYANVTVYAMTIVYILFLRKTVYDI